MTKKKGKEGKPEALKINTLSEPCRVIRQHQHPQPKGMQINRVEVAGTNDDPSMAMGIRDDKKRILPEQEPTKSE